jgi:hypothetical protein
MYGITIPCSEIEITRIYKSRVHRVRLKWVQLHDNDNDNYWNLVNHARHAAMNCNILFGLGHVLVGSLPIKWIKFPSSSCPCWLFRVCYAKRPYLYFPNYLVFYPIVLAVYRSVYVKTIRQLSLVVHWEHAVKQVRFYMSYSCIFRN